MGFAEDFINASFRLKNTPALDTLRNLFVPEIGTDESEKAAKATIIPHLIQAYGLADLARLLPIVNFAQAIRWQELRGTPASLTIAFEIAGVALLAVEQHAGVRWNFYTVRIAATDKQVDLLIKLCIISAPLRSRLFRIADVSKEVSSLKLSTQSGKLCRNIISNFSGTKNEQGIWVDV